MTTAMELSQYIIEKCAKDGRPVNEATLQRMLYALQISYCKATWGDLLFDDEFQAYPNGPIVASVHEAFKTHGSRPIEARYEKHMQDLGLDVKPFVDQSIESMVRWYPARFASVSQAKWSPWDVTYRDGKGFGAAIGNDLVRKAATGNSLADADELSVPFDYDHKCPYCGYEMADCPDDWEGCCFEDDTMVPCPRCEHEFRVYRTWMPCYQNEEPAACEGCESSMPNGDLDGWICAAGGCDRTLYE